MSNEGCFGRKVCAACPAANGTPRKYAEKAFDLIHPRGALWREVKLDARMFAQPGPNLGSFVSRRVVQEVSQEGQAFDPRFQLRGSAPSSATFQSEDLSGPGSLHRAEFLGDPGFPEGSSAALWHDRYVSNSPALSIT